MTPEEKAFLRGEGPDPARQIAVPGEAVAQRGLDTWASWEATELRLLGEGVDPGTWEQSFKRQRARQENAEFQPSPMHRVADVLPIVSTLKSVVEGRSYVNAKKRADAGKGTAEDFRVLAEREAIEARQQTMGTGETVGRAAMKVPGMIAEFGVAGKTLGPLGLSTPTTAATRGGRALQYGGKAAATGVAVPSMTLEHAQQRAVEAAKGGVDEAGKPIAPEYTSLLALRNLVPAAAVSTLNAAVLGSFQRMKGLDRVPTIPGRAVVKGGVGMVEQAGADTIGAAADKVLNERWKTKLRVGGTIGDVVRGEDGAMKAALAQAVTFSLFAASHDKSFKPRPKVPAPKKAETLVDSVVEFVNDGGGPEEALSIGDQFMRLVMDPRTAPDAFEIMKERVKDQEQAKIDRKAPGRYAKYLADLTATMKHVSKDALEPEQFVRPRDPAVQDAWRDAGFDPIERWQEEDIRSAARDLGLDSSRSAAELQNEIMDAFEVEVEAQARDPRPNPWDLSAPSRPSRPSAPSRTRPPANYEEFLAQTQQQQQVTATPAGKPPGATPAAPVAQPAGTAAQPPIGPPGAAAATPAAPPRQPSMFDRIRAKQAARPPIATPVSPPAPLRNSTVEPPAPAKVDVVRKKVESLGSVEKVDEFYEGDHPSSVWARWYARQKFKKPTVPVPAKEPAVRSLTPIEQVRERLTKAGLSAAEQHILIEREKGRPQTDVGNDPQFIRKKPGKRQGLGLTRARVQQIEALAREKAGDLSDLKSALAGRGEFGEGSGRGERGKARTPAERAAIRAEREHDRATDLLDALDNVTREQINANPEKFTRTGPDGTVIWNLKAIEALTGGDKPVTRNRQPATIRTEAVRQFQHAAAQAKKNPGPESLARLKAKETMLRGVLEQQGDKQPGKTVRQYVPDIDTLKSALGELKEMKRRGGESDFKYEERKRRASGARTLYREVLSDVKRHGKLRPADLSAEHGAWIQDNPSLKNILHTDPNAKGLQADEYAGDMLKRLGVESNEPVGELIRLINEHALLEEGNWNTQRLAREEAARSLQEGPKKAPDPWDVDAPGIGERLWRDDNGFVRVGDLLNYLTRSHAKDPNFVPDADPNPDNQVALPKHDVAKRAAFNQIGSRNSTRPEIATTAHAWETHVSDQVANEWLLRQQGKRPDPFVKDTDGKITMAGGQKGFLADVIEAELARPGSQPLTAEQLEAVQVWKGVREKRVAELTQAGVQQHYNRLLALAEGRAKGVPVDKAKVMREAIAANAGQSAKVFEADYFPRVAVDPGVTVKGIFKSIFGKKVPTGVAPGVKPGYKFEREHLTEEIGVSKGTKYEGFYESIAEFLKSSGREVADLNLANDPLLAGKDTTLREYMKLIDQNRGRLARLPRGKRGGGPGPRTELRNALMEVARQKATGNVDVAPAFKGKEYPAETKEWLERMYGKSRWRYLPTMKAVLQEARNVILGADVSWATLQMQQMMFRNPVRWMKSMKSGVSAFFDPSTFAREVKNSTVLSEAAKQWVQAGGSFGTASELIEGMGKGKSLVEKVPVVGAVYSRSARAMTTAIDRARLELWIANRPADPKQWPRTVEAIENSLGSGRMEQLGMTPERAFLERFMFLAPSYYRARVNLARQAAQGGVPGHFARQQLVFLAGGIASTAVAGLWAAKEAGVISDEEFEERLDPRRGKWLMVPVPVGDEKIEVGMGGFYRSVMRSAADAHDWANGKQTENPAVRWYRGHAAVGPRLFADVISGEDFQGKPVSPQRAALNSVLPVSVQQSGVVDAAGQAMGLDTNQPQGTMRQRLASAGAGMAGLASFPQSEGSAYLDKLRTLAKEKTGKTYSELSVQQQAKIVQQAAAQGVRKPEASADAVKRGFEAGEVRKKRLNSLVSADVQARLKELGRELPEYETRFKYNAVEVPLSQPQIERYEQLLVEEYNRAVMKWPVQRLQRMKPELREKEMQSLLREVKERVREKFLKR